MIEVSERLCVFVELRINSEEFDSLVKKMCLKCRILFDMIYCSVFDKECVMYIVLL